MVLTLIINFSNSYIQAIIKLLIRNWFILSEHLIKTYFKVLFLLCYRSVLTWRHHTCKGLIYRTWEMSVLLDSNIWRKI